MATAPSRGSRTRLETVESPDAGPLSTDGGTLGIVVSVMRRALLLRGPGIGRLRDLQSLRERIEAGMQRGYLLLLPVHDIAELDIGVLQERNFGLDPLDFIAGHAASVTNPQRRARLSAATNN